jgi:hypothetical protein
LAQPQPGLARQTIEPLDGGVQKLGVGWEPDVPRLHRGIDRTQALAYRFVRQNRILLELQ